MSNDQRPTPHSPSLKPFPRPRLQPEVRNLTAAVVSAGQARRLLRLLALTCVVLVPSSPAFAQEPAGAPALSLADAVGVALDSSPVIQIAEADRSRADAGVQQARSGYLPRVSYVESFQRSDNPVFAFGSLLNQGRFTAQNFDVDRLNSPGPLSHFRSTLAVEQTLFDSRRTRAAVRAADAGREAASTRATGRRADVILAVVRSYFGAVVSAERLQVAEQALRTAEADLDRAQAMFDAGMTTQADVLAVRVHRAQVREEAVRARHDLSIARAAVNDAMGVALERRYAFVTGLSAPGGEVAPIETWEQLAVERHPQLREAALGREIARANSAVARSALYPSVVAQGAFESHRDGLFGDGQSNWLAGVAMRWNLWSGSGNRATVAMAEHATTAAEAMRRDVESKTRLGVRRAFYELESARERAAIAEEAVSEAEASHGIVQNRYEAGLTVVTELIRSETALLSVRVRRLLALYDLRVARAELEHAAGNLTSTSEALR